MFDWALIRVWGIIQVGALITVNTVCESNQENQDTLKHAQETTNGLEEHTIKTEIDEILTSACQIPMPMTISEVTIKSESNEVKLEIKEEIEDNITGFESFQFEDNDIFQCDNCTESCETAKELEDHTNEMHSHKCEFCNTGYETGYALMLHKVNNHHNNCDYCGDLYNTAKELENHLSEMHSSNCDMCDNAFSSEKELLLHKKSHLINFNVTHTLKCTFCEERFETEVTLESHMKQQHILNCSMCDFTTTNKKHLLNHVMNKHKFKCNQQIFDDWCNWVGDTKEALDYHIKKRHFRCALCQITLKNNQKFVLKTQLKLNLKLKKLLNHM